MTHYSNKYKKLQLPCKLEKFSCENQLKLKKFYKCNYCNEHRQLRLSYLALSLIQFHHKIRSVIIIVNDWSLKNLRKEHQTPALLGCLLFNICLGNRLICQMLRYFPRTSDVYFCNNRVFVLKTKQRSDFHIRLLNLTQ